MAQFWASACSYEENENRHSQSGKFDYVGENFAATISYTVNYTQLIGQLWNAEKRFFNYYTATCYDEDGNANDDGSYETCGRYTQVEQIVTCIQILIHFYLLFPACMGQNLRCGLWDLQMC